MDPKIVDRGGKGILGIACLVIICGAKKYGPTIIKGTGKVIKK